MTAIEKAWEKEQTVLGKKMIEAVGIERALLLWMRGGEVAFKLVSDELERLRAEHKAFSKKSAAALLAKKSKKPDPDH